MHISREPNNNALELVYSEYLQEQQAQNPQNHRPDDPGSVAERKVRSNIISDHIRDRGADAEWQQDIPAEEI